MEVHPTQEELVALMLSQPMAIRGELAARSEQVIRTFAGRSVIVDELREVIDSAVLRVFAMGIRVSEDAARTRENKIMDLRAKIIQLNAEVESLEYAKNDLAHARLRVTELESNLVDMEGSYVAAMEHIELLNK